MNSTAGEADVTLLDADQVSRTVARIAHQIIEKTALDGEDSRRVVLLGIPSGGVPLAARLAEKIQHFTGVEVFQGSLDITLYRDDLRNTAHRALKPTKVPAEGIDGAVVVLVDDVLYSGRSIRAALDALTDIGRPYAVQVAVLIDRGHRKLPIRADYVGKNIPTAADEDVAVNLAELDGVDNVVLTRRPAAGEGSN
ncbi:bifunctional pyr operon transcriptional regulator/uracil phosphoribosyltransferase PyrR [Corynebacterium jeikeium]|uniref:bifunctional pyr operon transcriptional regulator/uracil phosphoribosyltransferase PyrR n=1 Tax=Corynebacterium jeikeium TaxID=38289 RepID=UPI0001B71ABA|nr:bifunctional pyr operon transcriptional regulator/uracil phosphoribosyltransferase PyrR [Corynebacterium jeikeium]EEW16366.1 phosphoribosyl transferase domain protein [Corynebacterium jeikeium ATCC 43734]OOD34022.1 bifunctional pyr operon transcriptional regulator/uracil phosphoribosyltransferase [Corynebacterium jeikeium]WCZ53579.1 Bifunctional protein PyrR [Corynebacterium jeikeium]SCX15014.1 Bifunctional protein PyrR [Corynebacterium jeikeium]SUY81110.1 bifunctional pyrimidine regulatory